MRLNILHDITLNSLKILTERELFPTSDCLKAGQREPMIHEEILQQDADIICLQVGSENPLLVVAMTLYT